MSVDTLRSDLALLKSKEADLRKTLAKHESDANKARAAAAKRRDAARKARTEPARRTAERAAESEEKKTAAAEAKVADVSKKLAANAKAQAAKEKSLGTAQKSAASAADRANRVRRSQELTHERALARARAEQIRYVVVREPEPEVLRILYLTANPDIEDPATVLRLDAEVRLVREALLRAEHRDRVHMDHWPAATPEDLIEGMNRLRPHIVHFSGHAGSGVLVFDNAEIDEPDAREIDFTVLTEILAASDQPPVVVVLNACDTLADADLVLPVCPVVIAMSDSVSDLAAGIFATRFYAAIAAGQSVGAALRQGKVGVRLVDPDDADLPSVLSRDDVDIDKLRLVEDATTSEATAR